MAFIYEKISEEDKARIDWSQFKISPGARPGLPILPTFWSVDRQRAAFFFQIVGGPGYENQPEVDGFVWRGAFVRMEVNYRARVTDSGELECEWAILRMDMPREIEHERSQILEAIAEAAEAEARGWRTRGRVASVSVRFGTN